MKIWKHRFLSISISVLLFFLIGEFGYRTYVNIYKPLYKPSRIKGLLWELVPSVDVELEGIKYRTNTAGLRDFEYSVKKPEGVFRIAVVGDSVTFGTGLSGRENTYPNVLERELRELFHNKKFEVLNFGIEGIGIQHELGLIKEKVLQFEPDMIILGYCLNGIRFTFMYTNPGVVWFLQRFTFVDYIAVKLFAAQRKLRSMMGSFTNDAYYDHVVTLYNDNERISRLKSILRELNSLTREKGIRFSVAIFPFSQQFKEGVDLRPQIIVSNICMDEGIPYYDTLNYLKRYNINDLYLKDDNVHFSAYGNDKLAKLILDFISANGFLSKLDDSLLRDKLLK